MPVALMAVTVGASLSAGRRADADDPRQSARQSVHARHFGRRRASARRWRSSIGVAVAVPVAVAVLMVPVNAFLMALVAVALHLTSSRHCAASRCETIVLLGIALVFTFNALLALRAVSGLGDRRCRRSSSGPWAASPRRPGRRSGSRPACSSSALPLFARQRLGADGVAAGRRQGRQLRRQCPSRCGCETMLIVSAARRHSGALRRHDRLHRPRRPAHRAHDSGRGSALLPAGRGALRRAAAVGHLGRQQDRSCPAQSSRSASSRRWSAFPSSSRSSSSNRRRSW